MVGLCEALIYGHKAGIELDKMISLLNGVELEAQVLKDLVLAC